MLTSATAARGSLPPFFAAAVAATIAYLLAARLGLALLSAHSDVAVFWPASGVAAGIFITFSPRARAALIIGLLAGTVGAGREILTSIFNGFWNAGEALLVAWLLERWFGQPFTFGDLRRVVGFLVAACLATVASGIAVAATLTLLHPETTAPYWVVCRAWFLSSCVT